MEYNNIFNTDKNKFCPESFLRQTGSSDWILFFVATENKKNILIFKTLSKSTNECSIIRYVVIAVFVKMYEEENPSNTFKLLLAINKYTGCPKKRSLRYCTTHYGSIFKKVYIFEIFGTFPID